MSLLYSPLKKIIEGDPEACFRVRAVQLPFLKFSVSAWKGEDDDYENQGSDCSHACRLTLFATDAVRTVRLDRRAERQNRAAANQLYGIPSLERPARDPARGPHDADCRRQHLVSRRLEE